MRKLIYSISVSLDGYIAGPGDDISWGEPSEDLHWHHNERITEDLVALYGRKLWETMAPHWSTLEEGPGVAPVELDFAKRWRAQEKVVFSSTLTEVSGKARLYTGDPVPEIERLKAEDGGALEIGGATLASAAIRAGLVDDYRLYYAPVAIGAGTPCFRDLTSWVELKLTETQTFDNGVVLMRYEKRR